LRVEFEDTKVKKLFEDLEDVRAYQGLMKKCIGNDLTRTVKKRYNELKAADDFCIYLSTGLGTPHLLVGNLLGCYGIKIDSKNRLIVKPGVEEITPETLKQCKVIIIKGVVDYHGTKSNWLIP